MRKILIKMPAKTYWSIIKSCYNGRKIPIILPLSANGKIITDFNKKGNLFNKYFCLNAILYQMTVSYQKIKHILQKLKYHLSIKTLDINKAHAHDEISRRM